MVLISPGKGARAQSLDFPAITRSSVPFSFTWSLSAVCTDIRPADFIAYDTRDWVSPSLLPALTFMIAALFSFATGTSNGTMSILSPLMVTLVGVVAILFDFLPFGLIPNAGYAPGVLPYVLSITVLYFILRTYGQQLPVDIETEEQRI